MTPKPRIAVVLFQLGGPDSLEAVEPFLYNLFCDPDIINFPGAFLARKPLAKYISSRRAQKVAKHYQEIGGKSPILDLTSKQSEALERELNKTLHAKVFIAMRYWYPFTAEVIREIKRDSYSKIVLLPLYPQYSMTTTLSSLNEWKRQCTRHGLNRIPEATISSYQNHPLYIEAIIDNINFAYQRFSNVLPSKIDLIFSAHGVPVSVIQNGDPYQTHVEETVRLVVQKGAWKSPHLLCYQSKVGPSEWLKPSLNHTVRELASKERKHLLVVPISFVTEHIETLHEINIETREEAEHLGIKQFEMMPALNDHPKFIQCLTQLVMNNV